MMMRMNWKKLVRWMMIYAAIIIGLWWLHNPLGMDPKGAVSTVKFVYAQF